MGLCAEPYRPGCAGAWFRTTVCWSVWDGISHGELPSGLFGELRLYGGGCFCWICPFLFEHVEKRLDISKQEISLVSERKYDQHEVSAVDIVERRAPAVSKALSCSSTHMGFRWGHHNRYVPKCRRLSEKDCVLLGSWHPLLQSCMCIAFPTGSS